MTIKKTYAALFNEKHDLIEAVNQAKQSPEKSIIAPKIKITKQQPANKITKNNTDAPEVITYAEDHGMEDIGAQKLDITNEIQFPKPSKPDDPVIITKADAPPTTKTSYPILNSVITMFSQKPPEEQKEQEQEQEQEQAPTYAEAATLKLGS